MTEEELQARIKELEEENAELKKSNNSDDFNEIQAKYEKIIEDKNTEINELKKTIELTQRKVDDTVSNLNDEVQAKLQANEQLAELNRTVEELVRDKAEATVDTFIQQGKILPAQRETALKLCLNDNDTFMELYRDAKPIVDLSEQPRTQKVKANISQVVDYFKN